MERGFGSISVPQALCSCSPSFVVIFPLRAFEQASFAIRFLAGQAFCRHLENPHSMLTDGSSLSADNVYTSDERHAVIVSGFFVFCRL